MVEVVIASYTCQSVSRYEREMFSAFGGFRPLWIYRAVSSNSDVSPRNKSVRRYLKKFYGLVHPDLFSAHPNERVPISSSVFKD